MFGNFIYFIVALLIHVTYPPAETPNFPAPETAALVFILLLIFAAVTRLQFYRLEKFVTTETPWHLDHRFNTILTRQCIMAVAVFALNIYGLSLPTVLAGLPFLTALPTLQALVSMLLFIGYMAIVWAGAHPAHRRLYAGRMTRTDYIASQMALSLPVLLPWFVLSGVTDIIQALPFEWPKRMLATPAGEIAYFFVFLLLISILGPALIQKFWRCKPLADGADRHRIENLCARAGVRYNNILHWPIFGGRMITAGVMGLVPRFRYIMVTDALLRFLTAEEIEAVIAHEIGHVKRKHLLFYLFFFVSYMVVSYATFDLIVYGVLTIQPLFRFIGRTGLDQATVMSGVFSLMIIATFLAYFRYIFGYFMRNFERQADVYVYGLFDSARPLISTMNKIAAASGQPPDKPNWHHFSLLERIDYLNRCESDRRWIRRQDGKIRKSIGVFLLAMAVVAGIGYQLNFGEAGRRLSHHFLETLVMRELEKHPDDPELLATLGDLFYSKGRYAETIAAYEGSLRTDPGNAHVLNNLAWLYATCEDTTLRQPSRALALAERAVRLEPAPHVWDTLAESHFMNGNLESAVRAERQALRRVSGKREYYERQLDRFAAALQQKTHGEPPVP